MSLKTITRYLQLAPPSGLTRCEKACNWDTFGPNVHALKHPRKFVRSSIYLLDIRRSLSSHH